MLLHAGGDSEDVRIEDDVAGGKIRAFGQQFVGAPADVDLALGIVGLALFVERHHDHGRAVAFD